MYQYWEFKAGFVAIKVNMTEIRCFIQKGLGNSHTLFQWVNWITGSKSKTVLCIALPHPDKTPFKKGKQGSMLRESLCTWSQELKAVNF